MIIISTLIFFIGVFVGVVIMAIANANQYDKAINPLSDDEL